MTKSSLSSKQPSAIDATLHSDEDSGNKGPSQLLTQNNTKLGIALMLLGFFSFSISDATAKFLTGSFEPTQLAWFRQCGLFAVVLYLIGRRGFSIYRTSHLKIQVIRGLAVGISPILFIAAIGELELADAVAVTFGAPFIVVVLGALFLKERLTSKQLIGIIAAFIGTMIIIRPGSGVFQPAVIFVFLASVSFALRQILSRLIAGSDSSSTTIAYGGTVSLMALSLLLPWYWETPTEIKDILLIIVLAFTAGLGEFFVIKALDIAMAVVLSPMHYTMILWGTVWGWIFFSDLPDIWTLIGSAIIILAGIWSSGVLRIKKRTHLL